MTELKKTLDDLGGLLAPLHRAQAQFATTFPGDSPARQPVHTVYGGAQLFKSDTALRLGAAARRHAEEYFPDSGSLAEVYGLGPELAVKVAARVAEKLEREAVEDLRIDFEDGYGHRPDAEEDRQAVIAAGEVGKGLAEGTLPPFLGIRIKPLTAELETRSIRTLDLFLTALADATGGRLPPNFVITLPKVTLREEVSAFVALLDKLERELGFGSGALRMELMVETTQSLIDENGRAALPELVAAAQGRCVGAHFGVYDYTASCNLIAAHQRVRHRVCDFARHLMQVSLAGRGVNLSDGATNVMPVGPHRAADGGQLSAAERDENRRIVHRISKLNYDDVRHSLEGGFYQGWDLHPAQLPIRYTAVYSFFLEQLGEMTARLSAFVQKSAQATLLGEVFDDAATGQALLNYFLRGLACGAISEEEVLATGLTLEEIRSRSFKAILAGRRSRLAEAG
jgi:citrate lyase beta subunit